jgi:hypothetical protein
MLDKVLEVQLAVLQELISPEYMPVVVEVVRVVAVAQVLLTLVFQVVLVEGVGICVMVLHRLGG